MVTVIVRGWIKKTVDNTSLAIIIAIAVFVNIGVWFIEQLVSIDFEMLSISYIVSELFLLGVHLVMHENQRLKELLKQKEAAEPEAPQAPCEAPSPAVIPDVAELFTKGFDNLTAKERELFDAYIAGESTKNIMQAMDISENTLKYHSRNLYGKLGVSSRKQMVNVFHRLCASGFVFGDPPQ